MTAVTDGAGPRQWVSLPDARARVSTLVLRGERVRTVARALRAPVSAVTPRGWTVLACSIAAWAFGVRLGWGELLAAACAGALVLAVAGLHTIGRAEYDA